MTTDDPFSPPLPKLLGRGAMGGVLMGLANLVPGISGGTMLLASGVYRGFVEGVAQVTTFRFRARPVALLAVIVGAALVSIVALAGPVKDLVGTHRWVMYSAFLGLTLGGVPLVWRLARPATPAVFGGALAGFAVMAWMAFGTVRGGGEASVPLLVLAGVLGASAMILPGISGAYMLLVLGQYEAILGAVDLLKESVRGDHAGMGEALHVVVPVGVGVLVGVVGISNLIRWTLRRFEKATLGVLLGLLLGSVLGIWPFQIPTPHGEPPVYYAPGAWQLASAPLLVGVGLAVTWLVDRLGGGGRDA